LRADRGDHDGALAAWRLGLPRTDPSLAWSRDRDHPFTLVQQIMLAAFGQEFSDAEVETITQHLFPPSANQSFNRDLVKTFLPELNPEVVGPVVRALAQTGEGRRLARQLAFREIAYPELSRGVLVAGFVGIMRHQLEPCRLSEVEEGLLRQLGQDLYSAYGAGQLSQRHLLALSQLAVLWRNQPAFLGWELSARPFDPRLRGPAAYFFGLRYLHVFKNPGQAAGYFRKALQDAKLGSELHKLATAEVERLKNP